MDGTCKKDGCTAPVGLCAVRLDKDFHECENFNANEAAKKTREKKTNDAASVSFPWHGEHLKPDDLHFLTARNSPIIIGVVGPSDAGKTSYLGMIYTLLCNGRSLKGWEFAGSYTLQAWEKLAKELQFKWGKVNYPPTTPSNPDYYSIYHLAVRSGEQLRDVLFVDLSGEVFSWWGIDRNDPNAESVRWLHKNSDAFVMFVDCDRLAKMKGEALHETATIAGQLFHDLKDRPVCVVWSKADLSSSIPENLKKMAALQLQSKLGKNSLHLEISNHSTDDPDALCHVNNLEVINFLMERLREPIKTELEIVSTEADLFFHYK